MSLREFENIDDLLKKAVFEDVEPFTGEEGIYTERNDNSPKEELLAEIESTKTIRELVNIVKKYPHVAREVIRKANSPIYPQVQKITDLGVAIVTMGIPDLKHTVEGFDDELLKGRWDELVYDMGWEQQSLNNKKQSGEKRMDRDLLQKLHHQYKKANLDVMEAVRTWNALDFSPKKIAEQINDDIGRTVTAGQAEELYHLGASMKNDYEMIAKNYEVSKGREDLIPENIKQDKIKLSPAIRMAMDRVGANLFRHKTAKTYWTMKEKLGDNGTKEIFLVAVDEPDDIKKEAQMVTPEEQQPQQQAQQQAQQPEEQQQDEQLQQQVQ